MAGKGGVLGGCGEAPTTKNTRIYPLLLYLLANFGESIGENCRVEGGKIDAGRGVKRRSRCGCLPATIPAYKNVCTQLLEHVNRKLCRCRASIGNGVLIRRGETV